MFKVIESGIILDHPSSPDHWIDMACIYGNGSTGKCNFLRLKSTDPIIPTKGKMGLYMHTTLSLKDSRCCGISKT